MVHGGTKKGGSVNIMTLERCLLIILLIVWICLSALELPWFHGLIICMVHSKLFSTSVITWDIKAESWSMDNLVGGPVNRNTLCIKASAIVCVFLVLQRYCVHKICLFTCCNKKMFIIQETFWHGFQISCQVFTRDIVYWNWALVWVLCSTFRLWSLTNCAYFYMLQNPG